MNEIEILKNEINELGAEVRFWAREAQDATRDGESLNWIKACHEEEERAVQERAKAIEKLESLV